MKKLIILDYVEGVAHSHTFSLEKWPLGSNMDTLVETLGYKLDDVDYLITDQEIIIH